MNSINKKFISKKRKEKYLFTLMSDIALSENHENLKLVETHLQLAKERNSKILLTGNTLNFFKKNKNFNIKKSVNDEFNQNLATDFAYEFLKPYAKNILLITYKESDLINLIPLKKVINKLNSHTNSDISLCSSKNWCTLHFQMHNSSYKYRIYSDEGNTKSPVTKGKIQHSRLAEKIDGADTIWLHNKDNDYEHSRIIETINNKNEIIHKEILELRTPSYYKKINSNENNISSIGGRWLEIDLHRSDKLGVLLRHKSYKI